MNLLTKVDVVKGMMQNVEPEEDARKGQERCGNFRRSNVKSGFASKPYPAGFIWHKKIKKFSLPKRIFEAIVEFYFYNILHREEKA